MDDTITPTLAGARYAATVPDTLDLAERARLALNGLGGNIDPRLMTMYGLIRFCSPRPHFSHWASAETLCDPKFAESFPLMRLMSGSDQYAELEHRFRQSILSRVDEGLYWDRVDPRRPWRNSYAPAHYGEGRDEDFCTLPGAGRLLRALLVWRELGGGSECDCLLDELCGGLRRILVCKDNYGYYPEHGGWGEPCAYPRSGWLNTDEARGETEGGEGSVVCMHGHQLYGAAHWYEQSNSPVALDLAARLAKYCLLPRFWGGVPDPEGERRSLPGHIAPSRPDPPFTAGAQLGHWHSHFHARAIALRGLLAYGRAVADLRILEFVRRAYEFSLGQGIARMGWINCYPGALNHMEGCALGDLVGLGVRLSDAGLGDYWDDVDAVVRNQLAEQQLTSAALLEKVAAQFAGGEDPAAREPQPGKLCFDEIIPRSLGTFAGTALPTSVPTPWVMHCCTGNATQGLYYAWEGALREQRDQATVNLLLNRAGQLVDVDSYLPYEGKVVIRNKAARHLALRLPSWVDRRTLRTEVNGTPWQPGWIGRYLDFRDLPPGALVSLVFALAETTTTYTVNAQTAVEQQYTCTFRGSILVDIAPRDLAPTSYPLYQRTHLRQPTAPLRQVERFAPEHRVCNW
ncbi:MAG: hypothetical protein HYW07_06910 [Candidatus Latescibacteria bacterium]|nr:hypothetical protein [Candidatus Latescibacterota bacterium]